MLSIVDQGPFEMIDMCNTLGIEPVITTTDTSSAEDFAGLVEYCYGNESTTMGAKRHSDGHPEPYRVRYFELGNEEYNTHYVEQVAAMEAKAQSLGIAKTLYYMFPSNDFLNDDDLAKAAALSPRIDSQLLADLHVVLFMPAASDPLSPPFSLTHSPPLPAARTSGRPPAAAATVVLNITWHLVAFAGGGWRCRDGGEALRER